MITIDKKNATVVLGLILNKTCDSYPEQYDVYKGKKQVGYLRLRHGRFTCEYPDVNGRLIYEAEPKGDGIFEDNERVFYLMEAAKRIKDILKAKG